MKRRYIIAIVFGIIAAGSLAACAVWWKSNDEKMSDLAAGLVPVSSAVDGYINFSDAPADLNSDALLVKATESNPKLLEQFDAYVVLVRRDGLASSVLLCDKDREHALMEDSGCTGERFDARLWEQEPTPPCDFQLDIQQLCKTN